MTSAKKPLKQTHPTPKKRVHAPAVDRDKLQLMMVHMYRGQPLDLNISLEEKKAFGAMLDADTKSETIMKFPEREKVRQRVRDELGS